MNSSQHKETGSILVTILVLMTFLATLLLGLYVLAGANLSRSRGRLLLLQAQYSAESGADAAIATLNSGDITYTGTSSDVTVLATAQYKTTYKVTVASTANPKERIITAIGKVYLPASSSTPLHTRTIRVTSQRSSTSVASSLVSRNILEVSSGVKNIIGRDVYINGYINMNKNTTNLVAENITVAGKKTGAGNCSIGGTGNLVKPASFTAPGQTKTNINLAFNNCISPPGNGSNANFNVAVNQSSISTVQSMYIPWSQFMDGSYTDAGSCTNWTSGGAIRQIPGALGSKKTHYPDSGSSVSNSCGTSGDIALGSNQYNITDNVHVRANFCAASACEPTFYNPTANTYFVFVEGTINFGSVHTTAGSGPIVFVTYGADPASKASVCPYGGSIYLGNSGTSSAKSVYFLATNGICMEKTKFGSSPALGGIGGKNIYIDTNPGTPFDLMLDPTFPVNQIPLDLSWRAVGYERL